LVGDIFGLGNGAVHRFTAEAIVDTTVRLIKRHSLDKLADSDAVVMRNLLGMTSRNLEHAEMLLLGRKSALEKVTAFLVEMDKRIAPAV
jgi:CRP/FNR family nitrogen fixation transcriptional regulator